ncbi:hypothetical protein VT84_22635 [Gemmata sp. SH-PL17]|uniref:hypothetical protein n=1 Tax=Gemmata sp. SH-PL17 TaxID=1630693 RepID=UPI00078ED4CD|nr:hypothetical protein [Gemmata sp. SH-PL17]AMV27216.1 hypothetical protein VT84_22635 [Gemmata sp. SH-PL17]
MNELEWLACEIPEMLVREYRVAPSARKQQLLAIACCRRISHRLTPWPIAARALDVAERFAEGTASAEEMTAELPAFLEERNRAVRNLGRANPLEPLRCLFSSLEPSRYLFPELVGGEFSGAPKSVRRVVAKKERREEFRAQSALLRDIFGSPFRSIVFAPEWRTDTVVLLSRGMYESRDFSAMPILADALQEAGCDNEDVLNHCRDVAQVHVRGCWVLDHILGKQ